VTSVTELMWANNLHLSNLRSNVIQHLIIIHLMGWMGMSGISSLYRRYLESRVRSQRSCHLNVLSAYSWRQCKSSDKLKWHMTWKWEVCKQQAHHDAPTLLSDQHICVYVITNHLDAFCAPFRFPFNAELYHTIINCSGIFEAQNIVHGLIHFLYRKRGLQLPC
jgi:hypothetical protein